MTYGWLVSNTVEESLERQITQKIFKSKIEARPTTWLSNIAIHLLPIWLQTLVVVDAESRLTSFPSFCEPPSEVAVLFDSNLSKRPFLGQAIGLESTLDLLLCKGFDSERAFCSYVIFVLRDQ